MKKFAKQVYLIAALLLGLFTVTGCVPPTEFYRDGKLVLKSSGNASYQRKPDGSETLVDNKSAIVQSYGTAGAKLGASVVAGMLVP